MLHECKIRFANRQRGPAPRRIHFSESGQSLVEVALILPFVLILLMGVIEIGRYVYIGILVGNAARAGAAYGSQSLAQSVDSTGITTASDNDFQNNGQNVSGLNVTSSVACGCDSAGSVAAAVCNGTGAGTCAAGHWTVTLTVTASGTFDPLFNYPGISKSITISRSSAMRVNLYG